MGVGTQGGDEGAGPGLILQLSSLSGGPWGVMQGWGGWTSADPGALITVRAPPHRLRTPENSPPASGFSSPFIPLAVTLPRATLAHMSYQTRAGDPPSGWWQVGGRESPGPVFPALWQ